MAAVGVSVSASTEHVPDVPTSQASDDSVDNLPPLLPSEAVKPKKKGGISIEDVKKNPAMAKLLIAAAKQMKLNKKEQLL